MTNTKKGLMESESKEFAERIRINQQKLSSELRTKFDYIVVGAGTSGSVVAGRLASDLNTQVLLLEAGGNDETELITNPNRWPMTLGSELDWNFMTEPNPKLNGRSLRYSMGKVLGGGSSINVSTWSRVIKPTGTSIPRNRAISRGVIEPFSTCIGAESRRGPERPIRIIEVCMEPYMCSPLQSLNRSPSLSWRLLNRSGSAVFRIRMAA